MRLQPTSNTKMSAPYAAFNTGAFLVHVALEPLQVPFHWQRNSPFPPSGPPPHTYGRPRPLPKISSTKDIHLHPVLKYTSYPMFVFNLLDHPVRAGVDHQLHNLPNYWGEQAATYPNVHDITIRAPYLDKPIHINRIHRGHFPFVTVRDVFIAVYRELRVEAYKVLTKGLMGHAVLWDGLLGGRVFWDGLTLGPAIVLVVS